MVNIVKQQLRNLVLGQMPAVLARVGQGNAILSCEAALRAQGAISRAGLMAVFLTMYNWSKLRKPPDPEALLRLSDALKPLDDIDRANMVFSTAAGEGAGFVYLDYCAKAVDGVNNRFTREVRATVEKAREKEAKRLKNG